MILYLDTSSLVKLYIDEEHSDLVHAWANRAEVLSTSRVGYPEAVAAVARRWREGDLDDEAFHAIRQALADQWPAFSSVDLNEQAAADLAARHFLRGFDAIHLAAALEVVAGAGAAPVFFSSFDLRLNRAAGDEGMTVLDASSDRQVLDEVTPVENPRPTAEAEPEGSSGPLSEPLVDVPEDAD